MSKKENIPLGVRQEFDDIDYWHKLDRKNKVYELEDGTKLTEYEFMKKFMHESFANNFSRTDLKNNILQTDEQKKWARRNNNNTNRDALNVAKKAGKMAGVFYVEQGNVEEEPDVWQEILKVHGYEAAFKKIIDQVSHETGVEFSEEQVPSLLRMYFRIKKFLKAMRKDRKNKEKQCKACNKYKDTVRYRLDNRTKDGLNKTCEDCLTREVT